MTSGTSPGAESEQPARAFETAQRDLFEAMGMDARSELLDLETPPVGTHVFRTGPADGDVPLVFVHGSAAFGAFLAPLVAQFDDVPTVSFDRPGYGLSGEFAYTTANLRECLVGSLGGVLDGLGLDRVDLVGHSMGGQAAIRFALADPERVRRLCLVGSVPGFPGTAPPLQVRLLTAPAIGRVLQRLQPAGEEGVLGMAEVFGERDAIQRYPDLIRATAAHNDVPRAMEAGVSEFGASISLRGWRPAGRLETADLGSLEQPTLLVWGEHDPLGAPADVLEGVAAIPDARFETVAAGHMPYLGFPERIAELIREMRPL